MANTAVIDFIFNTQGAMKAIGEFQNKLSRSVDAISNSAAAKLGSIGTALLGIGSVRSMFSEVQKVADFSTIYGKNIEAISTFNNLMSQFGANTDQSLAIYGRLQDSLTDLRTSASGAYKALASKLQINFWDEAAGRFKSSSQILKDIRKNWHRLSEEAKQDALRTLGINLPAVRRYLEASNDEMSKAIDKANKMPKLTAKARENLERIKSSLAMIRASFIQIGGVILEKLEKPIELLEKGAEWLSSRSDETRASIVGMVTALGLASPILKTLGFLLKPLAPLFTVLGIIGRGALVGILQALSLVVTTFQLLGSALVSNPIGLFLAALAAAAFVVYKNWDAIKAYFNQFLNWLTTQADKMAGIFERLFHNLVEWLKNILGKIPVIGKMINDELKDQEADVELKTGYGNSVLNKMPTEMSMIPRGTMLSGGTTTNNNQRSNVSNTYNVTFNGVSNADEINSKFTQVVRQGTTGVR